MKSLVEAFRLTQTTQTAVVGAGGKTTAVFHLARQLPGPAWVGASAHLGVWQLALADRHVIMAQQEDLDDLDDALARPVTTPFGDPGFKVTVFTGEIIVEKQRTRPIAPDLLAQLSSRAGTRGQPFIIEADGARQKSLKAPAEHEPPIPAFVENVIVVAGLSAIGQPLSEETVYGAERFARVSEIAPGEAITIGAVERALLHPSGGLKNIPIEARRLALLNQWDVLAPSLHDEARTSARKLLAAYDAVALAALAPGSGTGQAHASIEIQIDSVYEPITAIILAAGAARRMGAPKLLLPWRGEPVIRSTARVALAAGAQRVIVVTGDHAAEITRVLSDLPVEIVYNPEWQSGQASSLAAGLRAAPANTGAALFFLGDQPHIPAALPQALLERHAQEHAAILAPAVGGRRGNPVLFDRQTFADLLALKGDEGGRQVMQRFPLKLLEWPDERILWDIDTPEDYTRFTNLKE